MAFEFNEHFALPQGQHETGFQAAGTSTGSGTNNGSSTNTTSACDGIDHASLQDWLSGDFSTGGRGSAASAASTDPVQTQGYYDVQGADRLPDGTCSLAMLELNHPPTYFMEAEIRLSNACAPTAGPQPSLRAGAGSLHGFGQGHPLDDSAFPLPDLSTDLPEGHLGYGPDGPLGSAGHTGVAPSFGAGYQPLAGTPAAFQPIGCQNTLARPGNAGHDSNFVGLGLDQAVNATMSPQNVESASAGILPLNQEPLPMPGNDSEHIRVTLSWEMRNNQYFCLHPGCRNPSFKRLGDLERHQNNVHTQTKFFWCRYDGCGRGRPFPRKDKRNEHERKVHHVDYTLVENI